MNFIQPSIDPVVFSLNFIEIRWYSLAYIFGLIFGLIVIKKLNKIKGNFISVNQLDSFFIWAVLGIILGGRIGYVLFYNLDYYISNPTDIIKIWEGGMSFHGAMIGIIVGTYIFSFKNKIPVFFLLDIIACVAPIGIFFGRIANFVNAELVGKITLVPWGVVFPNIDNFSRHPSQLYEALLEGLLLFIILNLIMFNKKYKIGECSYLFLILYGLFRIFSEIFREPDVQIGYFLNYFSMGSLLSIIMVFFGIIIFFMKKNEN